MRGSILMEWRLQMSQHRSWKFTPQAMALVSQVINSACSMTEAWPRGLGKPIAHYGSQNNLAPAEARQVEASTAEWELAWQLRSLTALVKGDQRGRHPYSRYPSIFCTPYFPLCLPHSPKKWGHWHILAWVRVREPS